MCDPGQSDGVSERTECSMESSETLVVSGTLASSAVKVLAEVHLVDS